MHTRRWAASAAASPQLTTKSELVQNFAHMRCTSTDTEPLTLQSSATPETALASAVNHTCNCCCSCRAQWVVAELQHLHAGVAGERLSQRCSSLRPSIIATQVKRLQHPGEETENTAAVALQVRAEHSGAAVQWISDACWVANVFPPSLTHLQVLLSLAFTSSTLFAYCLPICMVRLPLARRHPPALLHTVCPLSGNSVPRPTLMSPLTCTP